MLTPKDFAQAIQIISNSLSVEIAINTPKNGFGGMMGFGEFRLHLKRCNPSVVNNLVKNGFILTMGPDGLEVNKI